MSNEKITLAVIEAYARDVGRGIARIGKHVMEQMELANGDIIEIKGKRRTVTRCISGVLPEQVGVQVMRHDQDSTKLLQSNPKNTETNFDLLNTTEYQMTPLDPGKIIRIDGLTRNNAGVTIGDMVSIKKIIATHAEKILVIPLESIPPIDKRYLADALESIPITKGDSVMVPYFGGRLTFQVSDIVPNVDAVVVTQKTIFDISDKGSTLKEPDNFIQISELRKTVQRLENELLRKHEEIKNITRDMLQQNRLPEDIERSNLNLNKDLISIYQKLVHVYRDYVKGLETELKGK